MWTFCGPWVHGGVFIPAAVSFLYLIHWNTQGL